MMSDFVADYGGVADGHYAVVDLTANNANPTISCSTASFLTAHPGDFVNVENIGDANGLAVLHTKVVSVASDGKSMTLADNSLRSMVGVKSVVSWGHTDNAAAFNAFGAANQGAVPVELTVAGNFYFTLVNPAPDVGGAFTGVRNMTISGAGKAATVLAGQLNFSARGEYFGNVHSSRIKTALAGQNFVELINAGEAARYPVGSSIRVAGFDLQSQGYPTSHHFFEYRKVVIAGSIITLDAPLKYTYKDTWPLHFGGDWFNPDYGGPATIYAMHPDWDATWKLQNMTLACESEVGGSCRDVWVDKVDKLGSVGLHCTVSQRFRLSNCNSPDATMECDKSVESCEISDSQFANISVQSSPITNMILTRVKAPILLGTPLNLVMDTCEFPIVRPGPTDYGVANSITAKDSVFTFYQAFVGARRWLGLTGAGVDVGGTSMTNGVIAIPRSGNPFFDALNTNWAVPDSVSRFGDSDRACILFFKIVDVTADAAKMYIKTNLTGTWPVHNGPLSIDAHPCPHYTGINCSSTAPAGTDDGSFVYGLNSAPPGAPLYSYSRVTMRGNTLPNVELEPGSHIWGTFVSLSMNVIRPYVGATTPAVMEPVNYACWVTKRDGTIAIFKPAIDIRIAGERKIEIVNGVQVNTGFHSSDGNYTLPEIPCFMSNAYQANMQNDIRADHGDFALTVTFQTDQGIPASPPPPPPPPPPPSTNRLIVFNR